MVRPSVMKVATWTGEAFSREFNFESGPYRVERELPA